MVLDKDKKADLKALQQKLGCKKLSFSNEELLWNCLKLKKGAVSPLGILNDTEHRVRVILDRDLGKKNIIGVHPGTNRATVFLSFADLLVLLQDHGSDVLLLNI